MKKNVIGILAAATLASMALAGCGASTQETAAATTQRDLAQETGTETDGKAAQAESSGAAADETQAGKDADSAQEAGAEEAGSEESGAEGTGAADETGAYLEIARQGIFSSGGSVTEPLPGEYDETQNWLDTERHGNTAHVDHANVLYQIPAEDNGNPIVYLHGYGQSRMGWMTTPDGREGWSDIFLRKGHAAFLVDQPRRGEAGSTARMTSMDSITPESKEYLPGDQAWYTHFRIGRIAPERYEGSQFPEGERAQDQFFRQMTPNTGDYDEALFGEVLGEVMEDVREMTGSKAIYITHSQGGRVGWATPVENISAIVAIEPGGAPEIGGEYYQRLLDAKIPIAFYFGDYIDNGPEDIASTGFWQSVRDGAVAFAEQYNADGGDAVVYDLPKEGITGNSHFMFQELNNAEIAEHIEAWLAERGLDKPGSQSSLAGAGDSAAANGNRVAATTAESGSSLRGTAEEADLVFPLGTPLTEGFTGIAYLTPLIPEDDVYNFPQTNSVSFEPGARSGWHSHGGMVVLATGGVGYYQEEGKPAQILRKGDIVEIPEGVKHWHGAAEDSWFSQIVIYDASYAEGGNEGPVSDEEYENLESEEYTGRTVSDDDLYMFLSGKEPLELETFSGPIYLSGLLEEGNAAGAPGLHYVVFAPGTINNWHTHEGGQILIATDGVGYHQIEGGEVEVLHPGDVAFCPPGVKHWHGGSADASFAHIAINTNPEKTGLEWFDRISEEEYEALPE